MASRKEDEHHGDDKDLVTVSESLSQFSPVDITEEPQSDAVNESAKSQKSRKFRRTALTFFGVHKNICILPSFFGGRSKTQSKLSSKKGITKSKTHDGLSKVSHVDSVCGKCVPAGDCDCHSQRNFSAERHAYCHCECSHPSADPKSLTLGRQKKGFRGFLYSFRHHRNNRNFGTDKNETIAMSSPHCCSKQVPSVHDKTDENVTECLSFEPDVPALADVICNVSTGGECSDANSEASEKNVEQDSPTSELVDQTGEVNLIAAESTGYEEMYREDCQPDVTAQSMSEPVSNSEAPSDSADQLNLIFGDVASLKSFDSLTGCGDIIADQEDDSITEGTVSGERRRNGGKRASCYLTYQGGGEEMASAEDSGCPHDAWGNNIMEEMCFTEEMTTSHTLDLNSNSMQQVSGMETSSLTDVLTPPSEHQESAPNSDEGYYDSTTPGHEDGQEKSDRLKTDRLPRDSYSGDALYELFAPDECLVSPHYENKSKFSGSKQREYRSQSDSAFVPEMNQSQLSAELYKVHTYSGGAESTELSQNDVCCQAVGFDADCNLNIKCRFPGNKKNIEMGVFEKGDLLVSAEKRTRSLNTDSDKRHSISSFGSTSDPELETFCETKEQNLKENNPVALPYKIISSLSPDCNTDLDNGQTVCFSQALMDYTKHSQMLSNLHNRGGDSETNSTFTPNMEALPSIVTFDVVDMHNEGEYDENFHMELEEEEDILSPFQQFDESYLQKDAFAEFDYQMLDLYEQNLITNTWAIASLPRHLGLTKGGKSMPNALSLDRRSQSLDAERLALNIPDVYRREPADAVSCPNSERDSLMRYKKDAYVSVIDDKGYSNLLAISCKSRSEKVLSLPLTDEESTEKACVGQAQVKHSCNFSRK